MVTILLVRRDTVTTGLLIKNTFIWGDSSLSPWQGAARYSTGAGAESFTTRSAGSRQSHNDAVVSVGI